MTPPLWVRLQNRYRRDVARLFFKRLHFVQADLPVISFTFDDFPHSALWTGGAILRSFGAFGTYYASLGLMGKQAPTGQVFSQEDLRALVEQGHELGSHTFDHCPAWDTNPDDFEASIARNHLALRELCLGTKFRTFSYPISLPRPRVKQKASGHFVCCRGGGQTFNVGPTDLNLLSAYFLERSRDNLQAIRDVIDETLRVRGWLIFATHDVCEAPTRFGCSPVFFEAVVRYAAQSGARILPVIQACEALGIARESAGLSGGPGETNSASPGDADR